ncbi:LOW QUALITY PROTEIN: hypothetical protein Fmac_016757 [Flemingia macrophylla]|uniref:Uncharacterized protein n=1 Tax=Flemingia macrophylla TaxID=520843 RepID=A0ABD1MIB6_9FABA
MGGATHVSTQVLGTQGYAAPEYVMTDEQREPNESSEATEPTTDEQRPNPKPSQDTIDLLRLPPLRLLICSSSLATTSADQICSPRDHRSSDLLDVAGNRLFSLADLRISTSTESVDLQQLHGLNPLHHSPSPPDLAPPSPSPPDLAPPSPSPPDLARDLASLPLLLPSPFLRSSSRSFATSSE